MYTCHINPTTKLTILQTCKYWLLCGVDYDNTIRCLAAAALGIFLALGNVGIAKSGKLFLTIDPYYGIVGGSRQNVAPLLLQL